VSFDCVLDTILIKDIAVDSHHIRSLKKTNKQTKRLSSTSMMVSRGFSFSIAPPPGSNGKTLDFCYEMRL